MSNLATVLQDQGKYEHAEEVNRRALAEYEALGSSTPDTLTCMRNLATVLQDQGKYEQANEVNRRALAEYEKLSKFSSDPLLFNVPDLHSIVE
jgi:tetratricopeptide (TPR) repeat protein